MNPAALKTNLADLKRGGTLIVNEDAFDRSNLQKAHYAANPLDEEESLAGYRVHNVPMTRLTRDAVRGLGLSEREADRCRNFFALGLVYWLYDRDPKPTEDWVHAKFGKNPADRRGQHAGPESRAAITGSRPSRSPSTTKCRPGQVGPRQIPQNDRQRSRRHRPGHRRQTFRPRVDLLRLSDHAGQRHSARAVQTQAFRHAHFSGRGRNRRDVGHRGRRLSAATWPSRPAAVRASASKARRWAWA